MPTALLTDPVVLGSGAVILVGLIAFFWGMGRFKKAAAASAVPKRGALEDMISTGPSLPDIDFRPPKPDRTASSVAGQSYVARAASGTGPAPTPAVSKEVTERLEGMAQRLTEMQTVLMKQSTAAPVGGGGPITGPQGAGAAAALGQGFTPETIEKLLKIIGNVMQQVDILQKSLNVSK